MKNKNKKLLEEIIRVDHAGERGAIKIYEGQLLALKTFKQDESLKRQIEEMKEHEKEHYEFFTDELTSICPITGQPDFGDLTIEYEPNKLCLESKSLKLYLWTFREEGHFCEALASEIAQKIFDTLKPKWVRVTNEQSKRGGIETTAIGYVEE